MADYHHRNNAFDYDSQGSSGGALGALAFVVGIIVLFFIAMLFIGGDGEGTAPTDPAAAIAPTTEGAASAPVAPTTGQ